MTKTRDFGTVLRKKLAENKRLAELVNDAAFEADVAQQIYDIRHELGISQKELANRLGTTQSAISRLESADYDGHSITLLKRVAAALESRLSVNLIRTPKLDVISSTTTMEIQNPEGHAKQWTPEIRTKLGF